MENELKKIGEDVAALKRRPSYRSRPGLYAKVFITMVNSCDFNSNARKETEKLRPVEQVRNVMGSE